MRAPPELRGEWLTAPAALDVYGRASGPFVCAPSAVARPLDLADVRTLVRYAAEEGLSLVPRGAGTGMPGGNVGRGVVVDLSAHLSTVEAVDPVTRTVHARAGAIIGRIEAAARQHGFFVPPLPSSADRATLGGMIANDGAGARTFRYGSMRAWVEEVEVVLPDGWTGRLAHGSPLPDLLRRALPTAEAGAPQVAQRREHLRKNSSGYALDLFVGPPPDPLHLLIGSEGTLGIVTAATLRLAPLPRERSLLVAGVRELDLLLPLVEAAEKVAASACEFLGRGFIEIAGLDRDPLVGEVARASEALVLIEVEGDPDPTAERLATLAGACQRLGLPQRVARDPIERDTLWNLRHAASPVISARAREGLVSMQFIEDSVVPVDRLARYLTGLAEILADEETEAAIFGHAGGGNVHVNPLIDVGRTDWRDRVRRILERTVDLVAGLQGTLAGEHGDGRLRAPFLERIWGRPAADAFRSVKETIDPEGLFAPGVIVPLQGQDPLEGISPSPSSRNMAPTLR